MEQNKDRLTLFRIEKVTEECVQDRFMIEYESKVDSFVLDSYEGHLTRIKEGSNLLDDLTGEDDTCTYCHTESSYDFLTKTNLCKNHKTFHQMMTWFWEGFFDFVENKKMARK